MLTQVVEFVYKLLLLGIELLTLNLGLIELSVAKGLLQGKLIGVSLECVILVCDALALLFKLLQIALLLVDIAGHLALGGLKLVDLNLDRPDVALDVHNIFLRQGKRMLTILNCPVKLAAGAFLLL